MFSNKTEWLLGYYFVRATRAGNVRREIRVE